MKGRLDRPFVDDAVWRAAWERADAVAAELERLAEAAVTPSSGLSQIVHALGKAGLLGLVGRTRDGGTFDEVRSVALCLVRERLGEASPLADLGFAMQGLGSYPLTLGAGDALRARWLPRVLSGEVVAAFALTEPEAGSDLDGIATTARRDGGDYVLDGHKVFISNAGVAGLYSVFAVTDAAGGKRRLSAFAVPADAPGLEVRPMQVLGGHPIGEVLLVRARVPASALIGAEGDGLALALGTLARFRPTVGAAAVGFGTRALREAVTHVKARKQFGKPLAEQQATQLAIADMATDLDAARMLVYRAAQAADTETDRGVVARTGSTAKLFATEAAFRAVDRAVQLSGGRGVLASSVVARLYEDVRSLRIYEGTSEIQKLLIAREVLRGGA